MATTASPAAVAPNGVPLGPGVSPNGDSGTAPNGMPLGPNVSPNGAPVSSPAAVAPNGVLLGPGVSPNGDTGTAPNGQPLGPGISPNGSPTQESTTPEPCPYLGFDEESTHCDLWEELQGLEAAQGPSPLSAPNGVPLGPGVSPNGDVGTAPNGVPLGPNISPNGSPTSSPSLPGDVQEVRCLYADHPTVSSSLCDLWCKVQEYSNMKCNDPSICPYLGQPNDAVLCDLWNGIQNSTGAGSAGSGAPIPYGDCPHGSLENALLACQLWCELTALTTGEVCTGGPVCPYDSYPDPHDSQLCALWSENEYLKGVTSTTAPNGVPLGPGVSPNGDSGTAPNGVPLGPNVSPNGSP